MGLVAHWKNTKSQQERRLEEFSWACQYNQKLFAQLAALGCDLENVVYYQVCGMRWKTWCGAQTDKTGRMDRHRRRDTRTQTHTGAHRHTCTTTHTPTRTNTDT